MVRGGREDQGSQENILPPLEMIISPNLKPRETLCLYSFSHLFCISTLSILQTHCILPFSIDVVLASGLPHSLLT